MKRIYTLFVKVCLISTLLVVAGNSWSQSVPWEGHDKPENIYDVSTMNCVGTLLPSTFKVARTMAFPGPITNQYASGNYQGFTTPLVADLNNDGKPEIIVLGVTGHNHHGIETALSKTVDRIDIISSDGRLLNSISSFSSFTGASPGYHGSPCLMAIGKANENDTYPCLVLVTQGTDSQMGAVYCYKFNSPTFGYSLVWSKTGTSRVHYDNGSANTSYRYPMPHIADFNGDGNAELLIYNKIYDLGSGTLRATTEALGTANVGAKWWMPDNLISYEHSIGMMSIADMDGDGLVEIVAGNKIYKPNLDGNGSFTGSCKKITYTFSMTSVPSSHSSNYGDGFTALGDIDGDGQLEVIVIGRRLTSHSTTAWFRVYAWRPTSFNGSGNEGVLVGAMTFNYSRYEGEFSMPFVGDIDYKDITVNGTPKKLPEICFITGSLNPMSAGDLYTHPQSPSLANYKTTDYLRKSNNVSATTSCFMGHVIGLTYDPTESNVEHKLKISWAMQHDDRSQMTGITTFDFTNSGHAYVVYRDETRLRVIDASVAEYIPMSYTIDSQPSSRPIKLSTPCSSYTGYELPVVADVDGDGSADFVTISGRVSRNAYGINFSDWDCAGSVYLYEGDGSAFVGAPKVWNQHVYSPLLINENLTVPKKPISMLTQFQKCDPVTMTGCVTITPYNGTFLQQPIVRSDHYYPAVLEPDAVIKNLTVSQTSQTSSTIKVKFDLENKGSAALSINTPVMFYYNSGGVIYGATAVGVSRRLNTGTNMTTSIYPGETRTGIEFEITGVELRGKYLWARITDDGSHFPATGYYECDTTTNAMSVPVVVAVNDAASLGWGETRRIDILGNDFKPCANTATTIEISPTISLTPVGAVHGTYSVNRNNQFVYRAPTHVTNTAMTETFSYTITCGGQTSTASIAINVSGSEPGVSTYQWTGNTNTDWNDISNWKLLPSGTVTAPPAYRSTVIIPEHSQLTGVKHYPELAKSDLANCDKIIFRSDAEVGKPVYLKYNAAQVTMGITSNRWHSISAPLKHLYAGDFIPDGYVAPYNRVQPSATNPNIYQKLFQWGTGSDNWADPTNHLTYEYKLGETMAVWADKNEHPNATGTPLTFTFPKDSTRYAIYEVRDDLPGFGSAKDLDPAVLSRSQSSKFVYEGHLTADSVVNYPVLHGTVTHSDKDYVIVGNPFMSHLDISKLLLIPENADKFENIFRIHSPVRSLPASYHTYEIHGDGTITSSDIAIGSHSDFTIPPLQSIILKKKPGVHHPTLVMPPSVSVVAHGRHTLRSSDEDYHFRAHVLKTLEGPEGLFDESVGSILIRYREGASNGYVFNEDATIIPTRMVGTTPILYSVIDAADEANTKLAINTFGTLNEPVELGISTTFEGTLKLQFTDMDLFSVAKSMWLEDKVVRDENGQPLMHNILENPVYEFSTKDANNAYGRFYIHINKVPTSIMNPEGVDYIRISTQGSDLTVVSQLSDPIRTVTVIDVQGRIILKEVNLDTDYATLRLPKTLGAYIVKVATQGAQKTKKVMVVGN